MEAHDRTRRAWTSGARKERIVSGYPAKAMFWGGLGLRRSTSLVRADRMNTGVYIMTLRRHMLPVLRPRKRMTFQQVVQNEQERLRAVVANGGGRSGY